MKNIILGLTISLSSYAAFGAGSSVGVEAYFCTIGSVQQSIINTNLVAEVKQALIDDLSMRVVVPVGADNSEIQVEYMRQLLDNNALDLIGHITVDLESGPISVSLPVEANDIACGEAISLINGN